MRIRYIGPDKVKIDTMFQTDAAWAGKGDVQEVPDEIGQKMVRFFPTVFEDASLSERSKTKPDPSSVDGLDQLIPTSGGKFVRMGSASLADLKAYLDSVGLVVPPETDRASAITMILNRGEVLNRLHPQGGEELPPPVNPENAAAAEAAAEADPPGSVWDNRVNNNDGRVQNDIDPLEAIEPEIPAESQKGAARKQAEAGF